MALIYITTMNPTKYELIAGWLPTQPWFRGDATRLEAVGAYRFDDPNGEVGMEGHLLTAGDSRIYHVPLTYRGAPLDVGEAHLLGTSAHGVLGTRWIYDGAGDPAYRSALARAITHGASGAEEIYDDMNGHRESREPTVLVRGSGSRATETPALQDATVENIAEVSRIEDDFAVLDVVREVEATRRKREDQLALTATWPAQSQPVVLALLYAG